MLNKSIPYELKIEEYGNKRTSGTREETSDK